MTTYTHTLRALAWLAVICVALLNAGGTSTEWGWL